MTNTTLDDANLIRRRGPSNAKKVARAKNIQKAFLPHLEQHRHGHAGWRGRIVAFLHDDFVHWFMIALLVLDVCFVMGELVLEAESSCVLEALTCPQRGVFDPKTCTSVMAKEPPAEMEWMEVVLHNGSVGILFIFMAELLLLIIGLGPIKFFSQSLYVLDLVVVSFSLAFDLLGSKFASTTAVLILLRMWRFGRIFHGLSMTVHEVEEKLVVLQHFGSVTEEELEHAGPKEGKETAELVMQQVKEALHAVRKLQPDVYQECSRHLLPHTSGKEGVGQPPAGLGLASEASPLLRH